MKKLLLSVAAAMVALTATPAAAHVTVQPNEAPIGAFYRFVVRVPNERPDESTTKVEVQFPETLVFVSFEDAPGWKRTVKMKKLDEPVEVFGEEVDEVVGSVVWSGGEVEPGEFTEFGFSARVPEEETSLEFPALQTYDSGDVVRWIGPADSDEPAALVNTVDIGAGEGEGELAVIAALQSELEGGASENDAEDDSGGDGGLLLGGIGTALGAIALAVALFRKP